MIAIWAEVLGTAPGDAIQFELLGPDGGRVLFQQTAISRTQARIFRWVAYDKSATAWPAGNYHVKIAYSGAEDPLRTLSTAEFVVEVR